MQRITSNFNNNNNNSNNNNGNSNNDNDNIVGILVSQKTIASTFFSSNLWKC